MLPDNGIFEMRNNEKPIETREKGRNIWWDDLFFVPLHPQSVNLYT